MVESDRDFIKIKWPAPESNDSHITGYEVERKDLKGNRWIKASRELVPGLEFTDDTVTDGHVYEYRIIAENAFGKSLPSLPSRPIAAKPQ